MPLELFFNVLHATRFPGKHESIHARTEIDPQINEESIGIDQFSVEIPSHLVFVSFIDDGDIPGHSSFGATFACLQNLFVYHAGRS